MTLEDMIKNYGGNICITIEDSCDGKKYCEEKRYDYYSMPLNGDGEPDEDALSDDNPNHYKATCLAKEAWWEEVKDREVEHWNVLDGYDYKTELSIRLK